MAIRSSRRRWLRVFVSAISSVLDLWKHEIHHVGGHYELPIPWGDGCPVFPDNKFAASQRSYSLLKKLDRKGLTSKYQENDKLFSDGYAEVAPSGEIPVPGSTWFLPHHGVTSEAKPGSWEQFSTVPHSKLEAEQSVLHGSWSKQQASACRPPFSSFPVCDNGRRGGHVSPGPGSCIWSQLSSFRLRGMWMVSTWNTEWPRTSLGESGVLVPAH